MSSLMDREEQWETEHRNCVDLPVSMDHEHATRVLSTHAGHGPACRQYVAALARVSTVLD